MKLEMRGDDAQFLRGPRRRSTRERCLRVVDLFSGCGGLTLGVEEAARRYDLGLDVRLAAELDPDIAAVYAANFGVPPTRMVREVDQCFDERPFARLSRRERAIAELVGPGLDLLIGGPPCQGHSTLNNHTRGDDPKNRLYLSMVRAAEVLRPRAVLVENVPAIERDRSRVLERATAALVALGYRVDTAIVAVDEIGVPQLRKRHVLLAARDGAPDVRAAVDRARCRELRNLEWAIADLRGARASHLDERPAMTRENVKRARYLIEHDLFDLPNRLRPPCQRSAHKYKSMYGRLSWALPAQTITTGFGSPGQGRYIHPDEPRTLTAHEAARLQFFPDWFDFGTLRQRKRLARAIGNAVPPKLSFVLVVALLKSLGFARRPPRASFAPSRSQLALFG